MRGRRMATRRWGLRGARRRRYAPGTIVLHGPADRRRALSVAGRGTSKKRDFEPWCSQSYFSANDRCAAANFVSRLAGFGFVRESI